MIKNSNIDNGKGFDWGLTSSDYAKFRDIYPQEFYDHILDLGICKDGQNVLDIGTGTGVLPRNMYRYGANFTGADISENQIKQAIKLSAASNMNIDYVVSSSEKLDFPQNNFDVITACQCFMYFDKEILMPNLHRILKPDGKVCILFMAWLPDEDEIAMASEKLVLKYNPNWTGAGMKRHPASTDCINSNLFETEQAIAYDIKVPFTRESWHGRILACRGTGASLTPDELKQFNAEHIELLNKIAPPKFDILHYVTMTLLKSI